MTTVQAIDWQGFSAYQITGQHLSVVVVPQIGGKIVSICDQRMDYEWLVGPRRPLRLPGRCDRFGDGDLSGWDEMFPTISPCMLTLDGLPPLDLPDHGELWSRAWSVTDAGDDTLTLEVNGGALPYRLERTLRVSGMSLTLSYRLTHCGDRPFPFIWAAHPLFRADSDSVIRLDGETVEQVMIASRNVPELGAVGDAIAFPHIKLASGASVNIGRVGQADYSQSRKLFVPAESRVTAFSLSHSSRRMRANLSWSGEVLRYCGLWFDEGTHSRECVIAPEPCTGYLDALDYAYASGRAAVIDPGETVTWSLYFESEVMS
jgi:galactose mutarotase-like enzyme